MGAVNYVKSYIYIYGEVHKEMGCENEWGIFVSLTLSVPYLFSPFISFPFYCFALCFCSFLLFLILTFFFLIFYFFNFFCIYVEIWWDFLCINTTNNNVIQSTFKIKKKKKDYKTKRMCYVSFFFVVCFYMYVIYPWFWCIFHFTFRQMMPLLNKTTINF